MGLRGEEGLCCRRLTQYLVVSRPFQNKRHFWCRLHFLEIKLLLPVLFLPDKVTTNVMFCFFLFTYSMNRLNTLPRGFGSLPALEVLDLTYNNLNENSLPGNFFYLSKKLFWKLYKSSWYGALLSAVEIYLMETKLRQNFFWYLCFPLNVSWIFLHSSAVFITDI